MIITRPTIEVTVGATTYTFSGVDILEATLVEEVSPIAVELPISELTVRVVNYDSSFSMFDGPVFNLLEERLPMVLTETVGGEVRPMGKFYLSEWRNITERVFELKGVDIIGALDTADFDGIFWSSPITLESALAQVLTPLGVAYTVDVDVANNEVSGWVPPSSAREALQQLCFAANATAISSRSATLRIAAARIPVALYDEPISYRDILQDHTVELLPLVTSIELVSHMYTQGDTLETIFDNDLPAGSHKVIFNKPYYNIIIDGPGYIPQVMGLEDGVTEIVTEDGLNTIEVAGEFNLGPNSIYLELSEAGHVTITGYPWVDSQRGFFFRETGYSGFTRKNALKVDQATLISDANVQAVLDAMRDFYRARYHQRLRVVPSTEHTPVKSGDFTLQRTIYDKNLLTAVRRMEFNLTGGFTAQVDLVGIEKVYVLDSESPVRRVRVGVGVSGGGMDRGNGFRRYD